MFFFDTKQNFWVLTLWARFSKFSYFSGVIAKTSLLDQSLLPKLKKNQEKIKKK